MIEFPFFASWHTKERNKYFLLRKIDRQDLLGLPYANVRVEKAVLYTALSAKLGCGFSVFTPGATVAAEASRDPALLRLLQKADLLLPDGYGCLLAARLCRTPLKERIGGIDFAYALLGKLNLFSSRVFFYGGRPGVALRAAERLSARFPRITFACADGYGDDPFERIKAFRPDAVFVCLGTPGQEAWIARHRGELSAVCVALGGSLDVWSGDKKRAPLFLQKMGLEWAYRTVKEPKRVLRLLPLPRYFWRCFQKGRQKYSANCHKNLKKGYLGRKI